MNGQKLLKQFNHLFVSNAADAIIESALLHDIVKKEIIVDNKNDPTCGIINLPFVTVVFGRPSRNLIDLLQHIPMSKEIFTTSKTLFPYLQDYFGVRLTIKRSSQFMTLNEFTISSLGSLLKPLPQGFELKLADKEDIEKMDGELNFHIQMNFGSVDNFINYGKGYCILHNEQPISFASSFVPYTDEKMEIIIATEGSNEYRRKGFATQTCAALLNYCLKNNLKSYWSAMNEGSLRLASKLGYTNPVSYDLYVVRN